MSSAVQDLSNAIVGMIRRRGAFTTLLVTAYLDPELTPAQVTIFPRRIFLGNDRGYLRISIDSIGDYLHIAEAIHPDLPEELLGEPSIQPTFVNLTKYYLSYVNEIEFKSVSLFFDALPSGDTGILRALALYQKDGKALVFDPWETFGIRVGNNADLERLKDEVGTENMPNVIAL